MTNISIGALEGHDDPVEPAVEGSYAPEKAGMYIFKNAEGKTLLLTANEFGIVEFTIEAVELIYRNFGFYLDNRKSSW